MASVKNQQGPACRRDPESLTFFDACKSTQSTRKKSGRKARKSTCEVCFKVLSTVGHLARHRRIHDGDHGKRLECPIYNCNMRFYRKDNLSSHYKAHFRRLQECSRSVSPDSGSLERDPNSSLRDKHHFNRPCEDPVDLSQNKSYNMDPPPDRTEVSYGDSALTRHFQETQSTSFAEYTGGNVPVRNQSLPSAPSILNQTPSYVRWNDLLNKEFGRTSTQSTPSSSWYAHSRPDVAPNTSRQVPPATRQNLPALWTGFGSRSGVSNIYTTPDSISPLTPSPSELPSVPFVQDFNSFRSPDVAIMPYGHLPLFVQSYSGDNEGYNETLGMPLEGWKFYG